MSKDRTTISNQIKPIQTDKMTLSFYPNLKIADDYQFASLIDGKIKVWLLDFSKGKGESVNVTHNLDIKDVLYLVNCIKRGNIFPPFSSQKIFGEPVNKEGFQGLSPCTQINITRYEKDIQGKPRRSPWTIKIDNGYGLKQKNTNGGYYMVSGSFKIEKTAKISLSDADFCFELIQIESYINAYKTYVSLNFLPIWLKSFNDFKANGYNGYKSNPYITARNEKDDFNPIPSEEPVQENPKKEDPVKKELEESLLIPPKEGEGKRIRKKILLEKDKKFIFNNGFWKIKAMTGGKTFWLYFTDKPEKNIIEKRTDGIPFVANMIYNNVIWFHSVSE